MNDIDVKQLLRKISDLHLEINSWKISNSQSNPGAVMELRAMKKELEKIKKDIIFYKEYVRA